MTQELRKYDVLLVDFGKDNIGSEQGGIRPAVIVQNNTGNFFSSTTLVIPFTKHLKNLNQPTHTLIKKGKDSGLVVDSMLLGECLRQVSELRIKQVLGKITDHKEQEEIRRVFFSNWGE